MFNKSCRCSSFFFIYFFPFFSSDWMISKFLSSSTQILSSVWSSLFFVLLISIFYSIHRILQLQKFCLASFYYFYLFVELIFSSIIFLILLNCLLIGSMTWLRRPTSLQSLQESYLLLSQIPHPPVCAARDSLFWRGQQEIGPLGSLPHNSRTQMPTHMVPLYPVRSQGWKDLSSP